MIPVECIVRGYLAGLGLKEYEKSGAISGVRLPDGLVEGSKLPQPVFTPSTKASDGTHDEFITFGDVVSQVGLETATRLRETSLALYEAAAPVTDARGIILADTKFEFGWDSSGNLTLGDEIFTSDSSRFWPAAKWQPGRPQFAYDKQFVRDWAAATGWDKRPPAPAVPPEIVSATRQRYVEVYECITGQKWSRTSP